MSAREAHDASVLSSAAPRPWFVVEPPWNEGAPWINAESPDPHGGEFVCDLAWPHDTPENVERSEANAALIVRAVFVHDELLALRDRLAAYVLRGEGEMMSLPGVLDELCRITLGEALPHGR